MASYSHGHKFWCVDAILHRTDGPAIEWTSGYKDWYLCGSCYTFDEWLDRTTGLTDEEKVMFKLEHG
jgi:hypothetical protein